MSLVDLHDCSGSVKVVEGGDPASNGNHYVLPVDALAVQAGLLHQCCFTALSPLAHDLSALLGAVKCLDRSVRRKHGTGWQRDLRIELPVYQLKEWRRPDVKESLTNALQYLTADRWQFDFVKRRKRPPPLGQFPLLRSPDQPRYFMPYSDGLDSFAQTEILRANEPQVEMILIRVKSGSTEQTMRSIGRASRSGLNAVPVLAKVKEPSHAEPTYRSRSFLFNALAGYAAAISESEGVVVPENGQGSFGGSFVRLGQEAPHRSCHPGATTLLGKFIKSLTGVQIRYRHPALYKTKGQVLNDLAGIRPDSADWLRAHRSCSWDARNASRRQGLVHCGVCGNCLLRRMSLFGAGIPDVTDYKIADLHAVSVGCGLAAGDGLRNQRAYEDLAHNSARGMQQLADHALEPNSDRLRAEIAGLERLEERAAREVRADLMGLLNQHCHEWSKFLAFCGGQSWVAQYARG